MPQYVNTLFRYSKAQCSSAPVTANRPVRRAVTRVSAAVYQISKLVKV